MLIDYLHRGVSSSAVDDFGARAILFKLETLTLSNACDEPMDAVYNLLQKSRIIGTVLLLTLDD
jgi:hypothetical protein